MMNSLIYKTLTKTPKFHLTPFSLFCSNYSNTPNLLPWELQGATMAMEDNNENGTKNWPRPREIPFQSRVANSVNLIGSVRMPVKFITSPDGKSWAGTIISQDHKTHSLPLLWIPVIFEGDLAHTAATHLKVLDNVYVSGHLNPDPLPINLTNDQVDVQVMVHDLHFVRGYQKMKKSSRG